MTLHLPPWIEYGYPSLNRPFGLALWPIFSRAFEAVRTGQSADAFHYVIGVTPFSTFASTCAMLGAYYVLVFGGRELMRGRPAFRLRSSFMLHNLLLTAISLALLLLFIEQLVPIIARGGLFYAICNREGGWSKRLVVLYYLNYMVKYIELLDTVFLVLKKKPLTFLHTYHHGATALLCYTQLAGGTSVSWVVIVLNLFVHVVMYWYYFQSARGVRVWWKQYITVLQITQFVIDLGFVYFAAYTYFSASYMPVLPHPGSCAGEEFAAVAGISILSSYLLLFISFYLATYNKPVAKGRTRARSALVEMKDEPVPTVTEARRRLAPQSGSETGVGGAALHGATNRDAKKRPGRSSARHREEKS